MWIFNIKLVFYTSKSTFVVKTWWEPCGVNPGNHCIKQQEDPPMGLFGEFRGLNSDKVSSWAASD